MNLAIMQPYLFPYIGYFQLICAADFFLIYDDVAYIKQGYINRNSVLSSNGPIRFTVPVPGASPNKLISELEFSTNLTKVLKTIEQSYSKAPYFSIVFPIIKSTLQQQDRSIASICQASYEAIFGYLGIRKQMRKTSELNYNRAAPAQDRIIDLCHMFDADCYINAPGGKSLYSKTDFAEENIDLKFIDPMPGDYPQGRAGFVTNLSIIDILMNCSRQVVINMLNQYELR